jgi:hypothetical protein
MQQRLIEAGNEYDLYQVLIVEWLIRLAQQGKTLASKPAKELKKPM